MAIIKPFVQTYPFVKHVIIEKLEGLYTTWNRGISLAQGDYICIWNVDDVRLPSSIRMQAKSLDENPEAMLSYGDFSYMYDYNVFTTDKVIEPEFDIKNRNKFYRTHYIGCFQMWRKTVHKTIGFYDEQLRLVSDLDFQIKMARNFPLVKTEGSLGYYLEFHPSKLSSNGKLQNTEHNVLYLRYGIYDKINWIYLFQAIKKYKLLLDRSKCKFDSYNSFLIKRTPLFLVSIIYQPRKIMSYIKHDLLKY